MKRKFQVLLLALVTSRAAASGQVLTTLEYRVTGRQLQVSPSVLSVPKNIAGSVLVELAGGSDAVPGGAFIEATLRGPSFPARRVVGQVNAPLLLPPLPLVGDYQLDNIRLVRQDGANLVTLMEGTPTSVPVRVFEEVLVSRVTSRPLTLEEIQGRGILIDQQNFRAIEFEVGFVLDGKTIPVKFPVVAPTFNQATEIIPAAELEERLRRAEEINNQIDLTTALPKELETARLNIDLKGINFQVTEDSDTELQLRIPPIPALMMIPGNIGFLNQFFSVQIFTENAAPPDSGLSAFNILAELKLPPGPDQILSTNFNAPGDDPLRFARVRADQIIRPIQAVVRPGADSKIGTADDIGRLFPGDVGQGEFLVEGLREGLHVMNLDLTANLDGLAAGTVKIKGRAAGSVLVRNPKFSLAFSHPRTVRAGEPYDAYVTVLNTSGSVANLVQVSLPSASISGGVLETAETVILGTIAPGQTATAKFRIRSQRTGAISFSNLTTSDDSLVGRFRLRMGIDERGVTLSPDTLAMPDFVTNLPPAVVDAANRVLGQALSVATSPQLPPNVQSIGKAFTTRRVLDLAEAGQRVAYGDSLKRVLPDLLLDWQGGREFNAGFDQIVRETDAGREWREALAQQMRLADNLSAVARLQDRLPDLAGRSEAWMIFATDQESGIARLGSAPRYDDTNSSSGIWFVERSAGNSVVSWILSNDVDNAEVALAIIGTNGTAHLLRWSPSNLLSGACLRHDAGSPGGLLGVDTDCDGTNEFELAAAASIINELPPRLISVRQDPIVHTGRPPRPCLLTFIGNYSTVAAVLFSKPLRQELVNVPSAYKLDNGNTAATVQIQPGGRVALLNLQRPVGPIVARVMTVSGIADLRGNALAQTTVVVSNTLPKAAGTAVRGRVARGDGSPAIGVPVTLTMYDQNDNGLFGCETFIVRVGQTFTDFDGYFEFDFILAGIPYSVSATDITGLAPEALQLILDSAANDQFDRSKLLELANSASVQNTLLQAFAVGALPQAVAKAEGLDRALLRDFVEPGSARVGTIIPVALRFRGRGTVEGQVVGADGITPIPGAAVNLFADPDSRELGRGVFSDSVGRFAFFGVPLGLFSIEAQTGAGLARTVAGVLDQPGETTKILVVLTTNFVARTDLAGRVTEADHATPHAGATVFVGRFIEGRFQNVVAIASAGADGLWQAGNIPAGAYDLVAISLDGKRKGERRDIAADAGTTHQVGIALQGLSVVIGKVLSSFGPVSNAIVAGGEALARTDKDGNFRITGVPTGRRSISAGVERTLPGAAPKSHPEFRFPRVGSATVNVLPGVENFAVIQFEPRGSVVGRVVDETGTNPVTRINVARPESGGFSWLPVNSRGEFAFEGIPLKRHTFSAPAPPVFDTDVTGILNTLDNKDSSADEIQAAIGEAFAIFTGAADPLLNGEGANFNPPSWGFTETELRSDGEVQNITIQFLKQSTVSGKVLNAQNVPVGARVRLTGIGPALNGAPITVIRGERNSDPALGVFTFHKQALIGDWGLQAASPFFPVVITANGQTSAIQPDETNVVLRFPSTRDTNGPLVGTVFKPDGSPASAGVEVRIRSRDVSVNTESNGTFNISPVTGLPAITGEGRPGVDYFVEAFDPASGAVGAANVTVLPGVTNTLNIRLLARGALAVIVVQNDGSPAPGAVVDFEQGSYPQSRGQLNADSSGQVLFLNLFEGSYAACAQFDVGPAGLSGRVSASVVAGRTNSVTVRLGPIGTIQGHFVRRDLVTPIAFAQIAVDTLGFATTDTNGFFRVGGVPLGTYSLTSHDPVTGIGATLITTLTFNGQTNNVTLVEQSRGEIHGAIIASDGIRYVPGALVTVRFSDGITAERTVTSGPDGRFSFPGSPAGLFTLQAEDPVFRLRGRNSGTLPENVARFEIHVALQPLASLRITALRPDGSTPASNVQVTIEGENIVRGADALSGNVVQFNDLPLATYRIVVRSLNGSENNNMAESTAVLSAAGQVVSNTVVLAGVGAVSGTVFASDAASPVDGATVRFVQRTAVGEITQITPSDSNGFYQFENVAAGAYQLVAALGVLSGNASGTIAFDGEADVVDLTLASSGNVIGRLVRADRTTPVLGEDVTIEFPGRPITAFLSRSDSEGRFAFRSVPLGPFLLRSIPLSFNGAARLSSTLAFDGETNDVGDLVMDEDDPRVVNVSPPNTATDIPITTAVELLFNEALDPGTIFPTGIYLQGPSDTVPAAVSLVDDTNGVPRLVRLVPNAPLRSLTTYQIVIVDGDRRDALGQVIGRGPEDLVGRPLIAPFISTFTTADNDPPLLLSIFPTNGQVQIDTRAVMRLVFAEPIRTSNFVLTLTGTNGNVAGAISVGLNGLVLAFAPNAPLAPNTTYILAVSNIFDLAGNRATNEPFVATFATLDTLGPEIDQLRIAFGRSPVAGAVVPIEAPLKTDEAGASVHFTQDFQAVGMATNPPHRINVRLPASGSTTIRAIASDRFNNQGPFADLTLTVVSNQPPVVQLARAVPVSGPIANGETFSLTASAIDDVDVTNLTVSATGPVTFSATFPSGTEQTLSFTVGADAVPGDSIQVSAFAVDALGVASATAAIQIQIADGAPPAVTIVAPAAESLLDPAVPLNLTVAGSDNSGSYTLEAVLSGGIAATQAVQVVAAPNLSTTNTLVFSIAGALTDGATILATVRAFDGSNLVSTVSRTFRLPDTRPPQLASVNPPDGSTAQSLWLRTLSFDFDEALDPLAANTNNAAVGFNATNFLPVSVRLTNEQRRLLVELQTPLDPGTPYTVVLGPDLADFSSNRWQNIGGTQVPPEGAEFTFSTAAIFSVTPATGSEVFAGQTTAVTVHFEAGLGADFFRFVRDSSPPVDVGVGAGSTNATANLPMPIDPSVVRVTITAHRAGEAPYRVAELDLNVVPPPGGGTVRGLITLPNSQGAANANVSLTASNVTRSTTADATGAYEFLDVPLELVRVVASDPATNLRGFNTGTLTLAGQTLTLNVALSALGTITGTVFHAEGTTPVPGAALNLSGSANRTTTADEQGRYSFDFVPLGAFTLDVTDPATGDRGRASNQLTASGQVRTVDVALNGQGRLVVAVRDASQTVVSNAEVRVFSQTIFGGSQTGFSGVDGNAIFESVLAGNVFVTAFDSASGLSGSVSGFVAIGSTNTLIVQLQPAGNITGVVFALNGTNPVSGVTVRLLDRFLNLLREASSDSDGRFAFERIALATYVVDALDASGRLRARENIPLSSNGVTEVRNLVFVELGTVTGRVLNPDATSAPGVPVTLRSLHPKIGRVFSTTSAADGAYTIPGVPLGAFSAVANDSSRQLQGETSGQIAGEGQTVTANIQLADNTIAVPLELFDANSARHDLKENGSIERGHSSVFFATVNGDRGALLLDIIQSGSAQRFSGNIVATFEQNRREIAIRQQALAGLEVTRKVFVPRDGYFARYLEIFHNPTPDPITVDVRVRTSVRQMNGSPRIVATSSGDTVLALTDPGPDRWLILDDNTDVDPFDNTFTQPPLVFVFDGVNASARAGSATFAASGDGQLNVLWTNIVVPPGGTTALLHFMVQQLSGAAAQAAAERLLQLPPEALEGLSADEIQKVQNFSLPADGASALSPLSPLTGVVAGRLLASDQLTSLSFANMEFQSTNVFFRRRYSLNTDESGQFLLRSQFRDFDVRVVPLDAFRLKAFHPNTSVVLEHTNHFPASPTNTAGNLAVLGGVAQASTFVEFGGEPERANDQDLFTLWQVPFSQSPSQGGRPFLEVLLPGDTVVTQVNVRSQPFDCCFYTRGRIDLFDLVRSNLFSQEVDFDGSGNLDLPIPAQGDVRLVRFTGIADNSSFPRVAEFEVLGSASLSNVVQTDLVFTNTGIIAGTVRRHTGALVETGGSLQVLSNGQFLASGALSNNGTYQVTGVRSGNYSLRVFADHPQGSALSATNAVQVTNGLTTFLEIVLPPTGEVTGFVRDPVGNLVSDAFLQLQSPDFNFFRSTSSDFEGRYLLNDLPPGTYALVLFDPRNFIPITNQISIVQDQVTTNDFTLPAVGTIELQVNFASGSPAPNSSVQLRMSGQSDLSFVGSTDFNGQLTIVNVTVGDFILRALDPANGDLFTEVTSRINANGEVVSLAVHLPGTGIVQGRVLFPSGSTAPGIEMRLFGDGIPTRFEQSAPNGTYSFIQVPTGRNFTVRAFHPSPNSDFFRDVTNVVLTTDGQTLTNDIVLPALANVRVTVLQSDGTPFAGTQVFIRDAFSTVFQNAGSTDVAGVVNIPNIPEGPFSVYAQHPFSGLFAGSAAGQVLATDNLQSVNITINAPTLGAVQGTIVAADSVTPIPNVFVDIRDALSGQQVTSVGTDASGFYEAAGIPAGSNGVTVIAHSPHDFSVTASANSAFTNGSGPITIDLTLPVSVVHGIVFHTNGTTSVAFPSVTIFQTNSFGGVSQIGAIAVDQDGAYFAVGVSTGAFTVVAIDLNSNRAGKADGTLADITVPVQLDVLLGDFVPFNFDLDGADGFRYDIACDGSISDGGTSDERLSDTYDTACSLSLEDDFFFECEQLGRLEADGRQIVLGPQPMGGLQVTRKIFVPLSGEFARYLEILFNPGPTPRTVQVRIDSDAGASGGQTRVLVHPSTNGNTFAVTDDGLAAAPIRAVLAHVFAGPGAAVPVSAHDFRNGADDFFYEWNVTLPAGGTVVLMHFTAQCEPPDSAGAKTIAEALASLGHTNALAAMSGEELAAVVNFQIAPPAPLRIDGISFQASSRDVPQGLAASSVDARVAIQWKAAPNQNVIIQSSTDLLHWVDVPASIHEVTPGCYNALLPAGNDQARFFRLHLTR